LSRNGGGWEKSHLSEGEKREKEMENEKGREDLGEGGGNGWKKGKDRFDKTKEIKEKEGNPCPIRRKGGRRCSQKGQ